MIYKRLVWTLAALLILTALLSEIAVPGQAQTDIPAHVSPEMIASLRAGWQSSSLPELAGPSGNFPRLIMPQSPQENPYTWSRIVAQSWIDSTNGYEIIMMNGDGSNPRLVTPSTGNDTRPSLNQDGSEIVFVSNRDGDNEIFRVNADGSSLTQLTFNTFSDTRPSFSPDGQRILFASNRTGTYELYTIRRDGSDLLRLTTTTNFENIDPAYSPDGRRVAFFQVPKNSAQGYLTGVDADGKNLARLYQTAFWYPGNVFWSPDGSMLAFDGAASAAEFNNVFLLSLVGPGQWTGWFSFNNETTYEDHFAGGWSPEGKMFAINRVKYTVQNNTLYITGGDIELKCARNGSCYPDMHISITGFDFLPDWKSTDHTPPVMQFKPLPIFSRSNGFPLDWSIKDIGTSGISNIFLQWRMNQGTWNASYTTIQDTRFNVAPFAAGARMDFRGAALDFAGNLFPYPVTPEYNLTTTAFTWLAGGQARDSRGRPLPGLAASLIPAPLNPSPTTGPDGSFTAWMSAEGSATLSVNAPLYGSLPPTTRKLGPDWSQDLYFPPADNLVQNGTFENGSLASWTVTGGLPANVNSLAQFTGEQGVSLGPDCRDGCPSNPLPGPPIGDYGCEFDMLADPDGTIHILIGITYPDSVDQVVIYDRQPDGGWSSVKLYESSSRTYYHTVRLARDGQGMLYAFGFLGQNQLLIFRRDALGTWKMVAERTGSFLDYALGPDGRFYLVYRISTSDEKIRFLEMLPDGTWLNPVTLPAETTYGARITVGKDGAVHLLWNVAGIGSLRYINRTPDGVWSAVSYLSWEFNGFFHNFFILTDSQGQVHTIFHDHYNIVYMKRSKDGLWSNKTLIPNSFDVVKALIGPGDVIHFWTSNSPYPDDPLQYWQIRPGEVLSTPVNLAPPPRAMAIDSTGNLHFLYQAAGSTTITYTRPRQATADGQVILSQAVTIPAGMHAPTLAFLSWVSGGQPRSASRFAVEVEDGSTRSEVFSSAENYPWKNTWVDLSAWAGKPVTLRFVVYQASGEPLLQAALDDISLGAWLTPVLEAASPAELHPGDPLQLAVQGENFIEKPQVWLDGVLLDEVRVIFFSSTVLLLDLPEGLPLGRHSLRVANPGGTWAALDYAFSSGWQTYLPITNK